MEKNKKFIFGFLGFFLPIAIFIFGLMTTDSSNPNILPMYLVGSAAFAVVIWFSLGTETREALKKIAKETFFYHFGSKEESAAAFKAAQEPIVIKENLTSATRSFVWWLIVFFLGFIIVFIVLPILWLFFQNI